MLGVGKGRKVLRVQEYTAGAAQGRSRLCCCGASCGLEASLWLESCGLKVSLWLDSCGLEASL